MKKPINPQEITTRLEALCARSEQCTYDIRRKLMTAGITDADSKKIIAHLHEHKFVDDTRFARAYVRDKYRFSKWGRQKIVSGLFAKHIERPIIAEAMTEIDSKEYAQTAYATIRAKLRTLDDTLPWYEQRAKLLRFAASRGYEIALSNRIITHLKQCQSSEQ